MVIPAWLFLLITALVAGSFLGAIIRRLGTSKPLVWGRSACESCGGTLASYDLVPLLSFVVLRGRCRRCNAQISVFHPLIEIAALLIVVWAMTVGSGTWLIASSLLGWALLGLAVCDAVSFRLPDVLTLPLLLAGLCMTALFLPDALASHAIAAALAYGLFRLIGLSYRRLRGNAGLGLGDAKLLAASGAWLGVFALPDLIFIAAASALVFALLLKATGRAVDMQTKLP